MFHFYTTSEVYHTLRNPSATDQTWRLDGEIHGLQCSVEPRLLLWDGTLLFPNKIMQLRPEWPWIFRSMCAYLPPYHIHLHVSYILSLSLPHISLGFICISFITATYILYFMTTTMIVTESEVFKVRPGAFPNSLSAVQLRDWLSQGCKTIFSLQS